MSRLSSLIAKIILLSVVLMLASCETGKNDPDIIVDPVKDDMFQSGIRKLETEDYDYEVKPDVKFMSKNQQDYLLRFESGNVLVFDGAMKDHVLPQVGDKLLMAEPSEIFPYGFFGTVTEVLVSGNEVLVKTKRPAPTDIFEELDIHTSVSIAEAKLVGPDGRVMDDEPSTATKSIVTGDVTQNTKIVPIELKYEGKGTVSASATISGSVTFMGSVWLDFSLKRNIIEVKPVIGAKLMFDADLAIAASFGFDETKVLVAPLVLPSPFGAISPALNIYAYFSVDAELHFDWSFTFSKVWGLDVRYDKEGFDIHGMDDDEVNELMEQLGLDGFTSELLDDEPFSAGFEGNLNFGTGLRAKLGIDVFGHPLYEVDNVYNDVWGGFESSVKWDVKNDTKYDVLKNAATDFVIKLGTHASAKALSYDDYLDIVEEEGGEYYYYAVPDNSVSTSFKRLLNARLDYEWKFTPYTLYLYPDFRDFSHELDDSGTTVSLTARNARRMLLPTTFGFEIRELGSGRSAGYFESQKKTWLISEKLFTVTCDGLKPGIEYGVYPYIGAGISAPNPSYRFKIDLVPATVTTLDPINVGETSALLRASFDRGECGEFTEKGFIYSLQYQTPDENHGEFVKNPKGLNEASVSGLLDGATYYVRAYGVNKFGMVLADNVVSFHTDSKTPMEVKTNGAKDITKTSAVLSGEFYENGHEVEAQGFCISATNQLPDIEKDAFNIMSDSMLMTSLKPGTRYYVRAYMTDKKGVTVYGNLVIFTTLSDDPKISVDPTSLTFPTTYTGKKTSQNFVVMNEGAGELIVSSLKFSSESLSADVVVSAFSTDVSSFTVAANGGRKEVKVYFEPPYTGNYPAYLTINSNDPKTPARKISLSAKSVDEPKPLISVPDELDFKDVNVGESKTLPLTISNTGSATLNISLIRVVSGSAFSVDVSSASIMKGSSKTIQVSYSPVAEGPDEDYILIKSDASNGATIYTTLKGNAQPAKVPKIKVSPNSLDFGCLEYGETAQRSFTVTNTGDGQLIIRKIDGGGFEVESMTYPVIIAPNGGSKLIHVGWTQNTKNTGMDSAIGIYSNDPETPLVGIPACVSAAIPKFDILFEGGTTSPGFGRVEIGQSKDVSFRIRNTGSGKLVVSSVNLPSAPFSMSGIDFPLTLAAGSAVKGKMTFSPTAAGYYSDVVTFYSNDVDCKTTTVDISGDAYAEPKISVSPTSLNFGKNAYGNPVTRSITITNTGTGDLKVSNMEFLGYGSIDDAFTIPKYNYPITIKPGYPVSIPITFTPMGGTYDHVNYFNIYSNATNDNADGFVQFKCEGSSISACLVFENEYEMSFPFVDVGSYKMMPSPAYLRNSGDADLIITSIKAPSDYILRHLSLPITIKPGNYARLSVGFSPTSIGDSSGDLIIESNSPGGTFKKGLSGYAISGGSRELSLPQTTLNFGDVKVGEAVTRLVKMTNNGTGDLILSLNMTSNANFKYSCNAKSVNGGFYLIPGGSSAYITVIFRPSAVKDYGDGIVINSPHVESTGIQIYGTGK